MRIPMLSRTRLAALALAAAAVLSAPTANAHCDTLDGPVVSDARAALETGSLAPVLKWVPAHDEAEVAAAFERARAVRAAGPEARELADHFFFETVVRLHRIGEGEPYTGLKPAGTDLGPVVPAVDAALVAGSEDALVGLMTRRLEAQLRERFAHAREARAHAGHTTEAGRDFVRAYVALVHYAELVDAAAAMADAHADHARKAAHGH